MPEATGPGSLPKRQPEGFRRLLAVLDVPPLPDYPSGWAPRYFTLLTELGKAFDLTVMYLLRPGQEETGAAVSRAFESRAKVILQPVRQAVIDQPGLRGALRRARHYIHDELPFACLHHAPPNKELRSTFKATDEDVVMIFLPWLAHLAGYVDEAKCVLVLEERWDKTVELTTESSSWWRREVVRRGEQRRFRRLYRRASAGSTDVVVISEEEREAFTDLIPAATVLAHGVDTDYFAPIWDAARTFDVVSFGYTSVGRNGALICQVIDRLAELRDGDEPVRWAIAGAGAAPCFAARSALGVTELGVVPDVRPLVAGAGAVFIPGGQGTGVKTTLLQAWSLGAPVVAVPGALRGVPAVEGHNVLVVESPQAAARAISELLADDHLRRRLGRNGRRTVLEKADSRQMAQRFTKRLVILTSGEAVWR